MSLNHPFQSFLSVSFGLVWATLLISPFAAALPFCVVLADKVHKRALSGEEIAERRVGRKVPTFFMTMLGGFAGGWCSIAAVLLGDWWECKSHGVGCHDGQGGIILVTLMPLSAVAGSLIALAWTYLSLRIPSTWLIASVFRYEGPQTIANRAIGFTIATLFWVAACWAFIAIGY